MNEPKLLGATLLHTRYGHWRHPQSGRYFIRPVRDHFRNYPGLTAELQVIWQRAYRGLHTIEDQQRMQWLSQATLGALDIYQREVSTCAVSGNEILEEISDWLANQQSNMETMLFPPLALGN